VFLEPCTENRNIFTADKNFMVVRIADKIMDMGNFANFENSSAIEVSSAATRAL
jgi:hypothetical protein